MKVINDGYIKDYTTYKLSGKIKKLVIVDNIEELIDVLKKNKKRKIIGNGSNLIISESYSGTLIKLNFNNIKINGNKVVAGAGCLLPKISRKCASLGLSGLEFACGIPASIGGAICMNAGCYGENISMVVDRVKVLDENLNVIYLDKDELKFGYRDSIFKHRNLICLECELKLKYNDSDLIFEKMKRITENRRDKQPIEYPSAGSVFKNPSGQSAGEVIEKAGFKGYCVNDACVSLKHANFIINKGNASAEDVINLINIIKDKVKLEEEQEIIKG